MSVNPRCPNCNHYNAMLDVYVNGTFYKKCRDCGYSPEPLVVVMDYVQKQLKAMGQSVDRYRQAKILAADKALELGLPHEAAYSLSALAVGLLEIVDKKS